MTGLGVYNNLLTGNKRSSFYDGRGYGINLQLFPKDQNGFVLSVGYNHFDYEKIMTEFQNLVASGIVEQRLEGEISYLKKLEKQVLGAKIQAFYTDRTGTENIFDNKSTTSYIKISEAAKYTNQVSSIAISGLYYIPQPELSWSVLPSLQLKKIAEKYVDPLRKMEVTQGTGKLDFSISKLLSRSLINIIAGFEYGWALDSKMDLSDRTQNTPIFDVLDYNFAYLSSAYAKVNLGGRWDYKYDSDFNFFLKTNLDYYNYSKNKNNTYFQMSIGLTF